MVAPVNKNAPQGHQVSGSSPQGGDVSKLFATIHARAKMVPGLHSIIREKLVRQEVQDSNIDLYMKQMKRLPRYNSAFQLLYVILQDIGIDPPVATICQVAQGILKLHSFSMHQARNAYSACLIIPGFSSLRFEQLLQPLKRAWSSSAQKYADFWDAHPLMMGLAEDKRPLSQLPLSDLRLRLIIVLRIVCLHRGGDLASLLRTYSMVHGKFFILIKRKGWKFHQWENLPVIASKENISPYHLLVEYVKRTSQCGQGGACDFGFKSSFQACFGKHHQWHNKTFFTKSRCPLTLRSPQHKRCRCFFL